MGKFILICLSFFGIVALAKGQGTRVHNLYAEIFGPGMAYSVNYDTRFQPKHNGWGMRIGAGYWTYESTTLKRIAVPVQVNYLLGKRRHLMELGGGATFLQSDGGGSVWGFTSNEGLTVSATLGVGYRFQPMVKGVNVRIGGTLIYGDALPVIAPNASIGFSF